VHRDCRAPDPLPTLLYSNGLKNNSKNKDIRALNRDIHDFKNIYQAITNIVNGENGDRVADPHSICLGASSTLLEVEGLTFQSLAVSLRTIGFNIQNSTRCSLCVECFLQISEHTTTFAVTDWFL
jgi:hypothetical protein